MVFLFGIRVSFVSLRGKIIPVVLGTFFYARRVLTAMRNTANSCLSSTTYILLRSFNCPSFPPPRPIRSNKRLGFATIIGRYKTCVLRVDTDITG